MTGLILAMAIAATPVRLEVVRGPGAEACLSDAQLKALVVEKLGVEPFDDTAPTRARLRLTRSALGFEARLELSAPDAGTPAARSIRSQQADCSDLGSTVAFALTVAIDPLFLARPQGEDAGSPDAGVAQVDAEPPPQPVVAQSPRTEVLLGVGSQAALGAAPSANGGAHLWVGMQRPSWGLFLEGRADLPGGLDAQGGRVSAQLLAGLAFACFRLDAFHLCGFGAGGVIRGGAVGLLNPREVTTPWAAVGARAAWAPMLSRRIGLRVFLDGVVPISRTVLVVSDEPVWSLPPFSAALGVGAYVLIP